MRKSLLLFTSILMSLIFIAGSGVSCMLFSSVEVSTLNISPAKIAVGEVVTIEAVLLNKGQGDTDFIAELKIDGKTVDNQAVTVSGGGTEKAVFKFTPAAPGNYKVELAGKSGSIEAIKPSEFNVKSLNANPSLIYTGQEAKLVIQVENPGQVTATMPVKLLLDGNEIQNKPIRLSPGETGKIEISFSTDKSGKHVLSAGGIETGLNVLDGKLYQSNVFGFSVYAPTGLNAKDAISQFSLAAADGFSMLMGVKNVSSNGKLEFKKIFDDMMANVKGLRLNSETETTFEGSEVAYRFEYIIAGGNEDIRGSCLGVKNNYGFSITVECNESLWTSYQDKISASIASYTLPLIITSAYTDDQLGFSFKLPKSWQAVYSGNNAQPILFLMPYTSKPTLVGLKIENAPADLELKDIVLNVVRVFAFSYNGQITATGEVLMDGDTRGYQATTRFPIQGEFQFFRVAGTIFNNKMYLIYTFAETSDYDLLRNDLADFIRNFTPVTPAIYGIGKKDSLFLWYAEIPTLDPALSEMNPGDIIGAIFSGLVKLDKDGKPQPDIAEKWETSADGRTFTFHLRDGAKFQNGRPVTAADFKYSWERACKPSLDSPTSAIFLGDIVGARDMLNSKTSRLSGVKVIDDRTLQVTIDAPRPYFLSKLAQAVAFVVDKANVSTSDNWTMQPNGTGPFKLKQWKKDEVLILEQNAGYYGDPARLKNIVFQLFAGMPALMYETGKIDIMPVDYTNLDKVKDASNPLNKELVTGDSASFIYLGFNVNKAPFDDPNVRKAFAMALDVNKMIEVNLKDSAKRAAGIIPEGVSGFNSNATPLPFDVESAKKLLLESKYSGNLPQVSIQVPYGATPMHQAMVAMWKQNLGIDVKVEVVKTYDEWIKRGYKHDLQLFTSGWHADYLDPQDFMDILFQSQSKQNITGYSNRQFDELVSKANVEADPAKRIKMYQDLESMVLKDLPVAPLYRNEQQNVLLKPQVKGYQLSNFGLNQWAAISRTAK